MLNSLLFGVREGYLIETKQSTQRQLRGQILIKVRNAMIFLLSALEIGILVTAERSIRPFTRMYKQLKLTGRCASNNRFSNSSFRFTPLRSAHITASSRCNLSFL